MFEQLELWAFDLKRLNSVDNSVTRFGKLFDFEKLFNAFHSNYFAQILHILRQFM